MTFNKPIFNKVILLFLLTLLISYSAFSWGSTGHKIVNRKSPMHLPASMYKFKADSLFYEAHASDADYRRDYSDTSIYAEQWRHYIDIDDYPNFHFLPRNMDSVIMLYGWDRVKNNGTNPWATKLVLDSLTVQLARMDSVAVKQTASDLGHYVADSHNPLHCTINYNGQLTNNYGIHSRYETTMINTYQSNLQITLGSISYIELPIQYIYDYILHSQSLVDTIMQADTYAKVVSGWNGSGSAPSSYYSALWTKTGNITKDQFQRSTIALASLWYTAWVNAGLLDVENVLNVPTEYSLYQNFPNPFNPTTLIRYDLASSSQVSLEIFDIIGRKVTTLFDGHRKAGKYEITFEAQDLPSGIYYCRMTAGTFIKIIKISLVK